MSKEETTVEVVKIDAATHAKAEELIKARALLAAGLGIVPVPVFNLASATAVQMAMVQSLTRIYNVEVKKSWIKNVISSVLGGFSTSIAAEFSAAALVGAPVVGASLAALSAPALNGLTTYALGHMFIRYFESPDGFVKANANALGDWFKEGFKSGREKLGGAIAGKAQTTAA